LSWLTFRKKAYLRNPEAFTWQKLDGYRLKNEYIFHSEKLNFLKKFLLFSSQILKNFETKERKIEDN